MASTAPPGKPESAAATMSGVSGSQTLMRGLDVLEAIALEPLPLAELSLRLDLSKSTTYRLAASLVERGFLAFTPREGYRLGPKLLELGFRAQEQIDIVQVARPHIEALAGRSEDTVHLGVLAGDEALYLDKIPGRRRINISSRVGDRQPLTSTGLGKALMLDHPPNYWRARYRAEQGCDADAAASWQARMDGYVAAGRAYDLEENEDRIRCVAAPVRDTRGAIVGAISVSSAGMYMSDERMSALSADVIGVAQAISRDLGWKGGGAARPGGYDAA